MSTFLAITEETNTFNRIQNSKWFAVKCIATIGSPNEGELLNMQRLINGERNWTQGDENYNTLFSSKLVCVKKEGAGVDFGIFPKYWVHTRTKITDNVYDYYFTLYFDWFEYSLSYIEAQNNNNISTSHIGFYTQNHTTYYSALELYSYGTYHYILSLLTYDSNKWNLSINANMPLAFNVEPNNIITAYYEIVVQYQDHNYLSVAFNTSNNWLFYLGGIFGVQGQPTYKLLDCVVVDSVITEDEDTRTTTINVKLTGDRDTIVDILNMPYPQGLVLLTNHLMLNRATTPLTSYIINDSSPIVTLPTTTQYNKGNITLPTNIAIVTSNETEQNKIEYNTADITYTLTNTADDTNVIQGQGVWSSKSEITDSEQGTMYDNVINVSFSDVAIGSYIYKVVYTYSDGNIYTEEIEINVIALTLSYFGVIYSRYGNVLNKPVSLYIICTTGSSQGTKPTYIKMFCTCIETKQSFEKFIYIDPYVSKVNIDFRPLLPKYYNANNQEYNIKIDSILYNSDFESYETATDNITLSIIDATDKIAFPMFLYESNCTQITNAILPQFLAPLQGYNTKLWISFFSGQKRLFLNNDLIYTTPPSLSWDYAWKAVLIDFTNVTGNDMLVMRGLWSVADTIKPLISVNAEKVMVKFNAPDDIEMPEFAMILESIYTDQQLTDTFFQNSRTYSILFNMYNCIEKVKLSIPMLTAKSIYYYNDLFANQNIIKVSNGDEWQKYQLTKINVQEATENYNNGKFTIELENILTTKKYIQI